jgi:hypothetical protein
MQIDDELNEEEIDFLYFLKILIEGTLWILLALLTFFNFEAIGNLVDSIFKMESYMQIIWLPIILFVFLFVHFFSLIILKLSSTIREYYQKR